MHRLRPNRELEAKHLPITAGDTNSHRHEVRMQGSCLSFVLQLVPDPGFQVPCNNVTTVSTAETNMLESQACSPSVKVL